MEVKRFLAAMGVGAAAGTAVGMMLPRNKTMRQVGRYGHPGHGHRGAQNAVTP